MHSTNFHFYNNKNYLYSKPVKGLQFCEVGYGFGFNGQEKDDEIAGEGNIKTAEFWEYDTRLGRRWNIDPVTIVGESEYSTFANNPIFSNDPDGDDVPKKLNVWQRAKNTFSGNGYKNRANSYAVKNNIDESHIKTDANGNISMNFSKVVNYSNNNKGIGYELEKIETQFNTDGSTSFKSYNSTNNWTGVGGLFSLTNMDFHPDFFDKAGVESGDAPDVGVKGINTVYKYIKGGLPYIGKTFKLATRYSKDFLSSNRVKPILNGIKDSKVLRAVEQRVHEFMKRNGPVANDRNPFNPKRKDYLEYMKKADDWLEKNAPNWEELFK